MFQLVAVPEYSRKIRYIDSINGPNRIKFYVNNEKDFQLRRRKLYYVHFWVIPRRLSFNSRRFGTPYRFHRHRQVDIPTQQVYIPCTSCH